MLSEYSQLILHALQHIQNLTYHPRSSVKQNTRRYLYISFSRAVLTNFELSPCKKDNRMETVVHNSLHLCTIQNQDS